MTAELIVIAGPTASGKTALAVRMAKRLGGEIVNADSQQVYQRFDIGTAKPPPEVLREVPHHLISVVNPLEQFTAVRFQELADAAIADIASRSRPVIVVGGTGLYLRVLLRGVMPAPAAQPELRARLEREAAEMGREALHARLAERDPESARTIAPVDLLRVIRALEILEVSGVPASEHRRRHAFSQSRYAHRLYVLDPPREQLYDAINTRTREMFDGGLVEEARALIGEGYEEAPPMRSVGYAQARRVVRGEWSVEEAIASTAQETRHYAKRQLTWFRKEPGARFIPPPYSEVE